MLLFHDGIFIDKTSCNSTINRCGFLGTIFGDMIFFSYLCTH